MSQHQERELLELAAKAVGGTLSEGHTKRRTGATWDEWEWIGDPGIALRGAVLHPLSDDGDALRLAVQLEIEIRVFNGKAHAGKQGRFWFTEAWFPDGDVFAAVRRAIVRAAAEIGNKL